MTLPKSQSKGFCSSDDIREAALAFQRSRIILTAYELGIFTALDEESCTSKEVADLLGIAERSTEMLMNALCALGLLEKKDNTFSNRDIASKFLVKGRAEYLEGLMHAVRMWDSWSSLTQAVRKGSSVLFNSMNERGDEWLTSFIAAMHERACLQAKGIVAHIDLSGVSRVLDVGGGSGAYAMEFVRAKEGIKATVFDLPNVVPLTKKYIEEEGLAGRIDITVGDYTSDDMGKGFDLIFLSAIVHMNSFSQNQILIKKLSESLNPRGQIIIQDFIMDEDRTCPVFGALFALNMLVATECGDTYTESEVRTWMNESGLSCVERKDTEFGTSLIIGRKK